MLSGGRSVMEFGVLEQAFRWGAMVIGAVALMSLVVAWWTARGKGRARAVIDYRATAIPFSDAEVRFLSVLDEAVGDEHRVFGKMRVADLLSVGLVEDRAAWQRAFNRISAKHVDFVVCRRDTLEIVAVVELDDRSHTSVARQQRDAFLERAFTSAGVLLKRVPVRSRYEVEAVRALVLDDAAAAFGGVATVPSANQGGAVHRRCHACGSPMELRRASRGAEGVQEYFVCVNAPRCNARVPVRA